MKNLVWAVGGFCAAAVGFLVLGAARTRSLSNAPVDELAHRLEDAWADHHTIA